MRDLTFEEFCIAWSTYWGRRGIGVVANDSVASSIQKDHRVMRELHTQWRTARSTYPADSRLWLMGTPDLAPDVFEKRSVDSIAMPPAPRIGRFVVPNPNVSGFSPLAGDYEEHSPPNAPATRYARRLLRGPPGTLVSVASLLVVWLPVIAVPLALLGLAWTIPANRILHQGKPPWRYRWPTIVGQSIATLTLALSIVLVATTQSLTPFVSQEDTIVTHAEPGTLSGDIVARIWSHWPEAEISMTLIDDDPDRPEYVRVRVAERVYLDAIPNEFGWAARPMTIQAAGIRPAPGNATYGIGVTTADGADAIADRFYEEVRYWWTMLHPTTVDAGQSS